MLQIRGAMPFGLKPALFETLYAAVCDELGAEKSEVGLQFVSSTKIAQLNARYAGKDIVTDVLSFESDQPNSKGDIVICSRIAQSQAISHGVSVESELGLLFVHGLLHLLGLDHQNEKGRDQMRLIQSEILSTAGLEAPTYP